MKERGGKVTQIAIARLVGLHVSTISKILNRRPGPSHSRKTIRKVFEAARRLGYPVECLKHEHRRRHRRRIVNLPVEISLYLAGDVLYDRGTAVLRDVSLSGALLRAMVLPGMRLPTNLHSLGIRLLKGRLQDTEVRGRPVRFSYGEEDSLGLAVEFLGTEELKAKRLAAVRA